MTAPMRNPPPANTPPLRDGDEQTPDEHIELEVLINPHSGDQETRERYAQVALHSRKARVTEVTSVDEMRRLMQAFAQHENPPRVAVVGGDGTVNQACCILANLEIEHVQADASVAPLELAVLPSGTANDFAQALGVPIEPDEAWRVARQGVSRAVRLGRCVETGQTFGNIASGGISDAITRRLEEQPELKATWGRLAYARAATSEAMDPESYDVTITLDGTTTLRHRVEAVLFANSPRTGGQVLLPQADVFEPQLDVALFTTSDLGERMTLLSSLLKGELAEHPLCHLHRASRVTIESDPPMHFVLDGELLERQTPLTFDVHPRALRIALPA